MKVFALNAYQISFIIIVPIIILIIIFIFVFIPLRKRFIKKKYDEYYYKTIRHIVDREDYYLINKFIFKIDNTHTGTVDHIIFGDKYFYLITSKYYDGDITGKQFDKSLILISPKGTKSYISNPFLTSQKLLERLSMNTDVDSDLMIGIVVTNKEVNISISQDSKQYYAIQINKLPALIRAIEARDIPTINEKQLGNAVKVFDELNRRHGKNG